jgi:hypothetical protein
LIQPPRGNEILVSYYRAFDQYAARDFKGVVSIFTIEMFNDSPRLLKKPVCSKKISLKKCINNITYQTITIQNLCCYKTLYLQNPE